MSARARAHELPTENNEEGFTVWPPHTLSQNAHSWPQSSAYHSLNALRNASFCLPSEPPFTLYALANSFSDGGPAMHLALLCLAPMMTSRNGQPEEHK